MLNLMNHNAGFQESMYENQLAAEDELYGSLEEAVKACECYQAYHVGEHTAYSNWGTALAALIVERVSGMSYVDYVRQNIFKPLGMEHTSVGMHMEDNDWVRKQREELKCYLRYEQEEYNENYGVCHSWVQLYPVLRSEPPRIWQNLPRVLWQRIVRFLSVTKQEMKCLMHLLFMETVILQKTVTGCGRSSFRFRPWGMAAIQGAVPPICSLIQRVDWELSYWQTNLEKRCFARDL